MFGQLLVWLQGLASHDEVRVAAEHLARKRGQKLLAGKFNPKWFADAGQCAVRHLMDGRKHCVHKKGPDGIDCVLPE